MTGTHVIIRWLRPLPFEGDETQVREQTLREGFVLARLHHRNLPRVLEVMEEDERLYLILEDFDGRTLDTVVKEHAAASGAPLAEARIVQLLHQFMDVLHFLHTQSPPIIHRDLRPHSVMLTSRGLILLADFGLARMEDPGKTRFSSQGSNNYAAPEQITGTSHSRPATDIYSLGCIAYFLASGQHPPARPTASSTRCRAPPLRGLRPDLTAALVDTVEKMMEVTAALRPASIPEVRQALQPR